MKRKLETFGKWLSLAALVLFVGLAVTACKPNVDEEASIYGTWTSAWGEEFIITETTLTNKYSGSVSYAGDNLVINEIDEKSGYIYIKYTENSWLSDVVGNWYALYYCDLTAKSVNISGAYGAVSSTETLEEATTTFTVENGYFDGKSECVKTK